MSFNRLYEITRRSFQAYKANMNAAGQNVANAQTEGYSRRRTTLGPDATVSPGLHTNTFGVAASGNGVSVDRYERVRDEMLDTAKWDAQSGLGSANEESRLLQTLEGVLAPGGTAGLNDQMEQFFGAWSDVAAHPTDRNVRRTLLGKAEGLTSTLHRLDDDLNRLTSETKTALKDGLDTINDHLDKIATLNETVREAAQSGSPDLAAKDERDRLVSKLAELAPVEVQREENGYTVAIQGKTVVQGDTATHLERFGSEDSQVRLQGTNTSLAVPDQEGGKLGVWMRTLNTTLPDAQNELDTIARDLVDKVNSEHRAGYGLDDVNGRDFFNEPADLSTVTAGNIAVALSDPEKIAASSEPGAPGNSEQAQTIADLRTTLSEQTASLMTEVGTKLKRTSSQARAQQSALNHIEGMVQGTSGVSIDEEMTNLIESQQAFSASARVLQTAEEMMDTLLRI